MAIDPVTQTTQTQEVKKTDTTTAATTETEEELFEVTNELQDVVNLSSTEEAEETEATEEADATETTTTNTEDAEAIAEEIEELEKQKEENEETIKQLQEEIQQITEEVQAEIEAAIAAQEKIADAQEDEINKIIAEQLDAYEDANGEMTLEDFQANVSAAIGSSTNAATRELDDTVSSILQANTKLNTVDNLFSQIQELSVENNSLTQQIDTKQSEYDAAIEAEEKAAAAAASDPISFKLNGAQYDFIVDDGAFDSASDFLGANNYFEAMQQLDTDGDNKVSQDEMEAGGIKLVKTENGKQSVVDVASVFDDDDFVDLSSYSSVNSVAAAKSEISSGANQSVLGTFGLTIGADNQTIEGTSTLDSDDYLNATYGFNAGELAANDELTQFVEEYTGKVVELKGKLEQTAASMGITEDQMLSYASMSKSQANIDAKEIEEDIEENIKAEQEAEKAEKLEDEDLTDDEKKKLLEEDE